MEKYVENLIRKLVAETEFIEEVKSRINDINSLYAANMVSIEKLATTTEDYDLLCSALWDAYEREMEVLKQLCVQHGVSKANMLMIFAR